jgi:hypothetical protein
MTFPPLAPKKVSPPPAFDLTPLRLDLEKVPDEWVTVRGKKPPTIEVPPTAPLKRDMKMVATVNSKDLLESVENWMESGLTELILTIEYD